MWPILILLRYRYIHMFLNHYIWSRKDIYLHRNRSSMLHQGILSILYQDIYIGYRNTLQSLLLQVGKHQDQYQDSYHPIALLKLQRILYLYSLLHLAEHNRSSLYNLYYNKMLLQLRKIQGLGHQIYTLLLHIYIHY